MSADLVAAEELEQATAGTWQVICQLGEPTAGMQVSAGGQGVGGPLWLYPRAERERFLMGRGEADSLAEKDEQIKLLEDALAATKKSLEDAYVMIVGARNAVDIKIKDPTRAHLVEAVARAANHLKVSR